MSSYAGVGDNEEYLEHFGVKGMRWGVRRTPEQLRSKAQRTEDTAKAKASAARAKQKLKTQKAKGVENRLGPRGQFVRRNEAVADKYDRISKSGKGRKFVAGMFEISVADMIASGGSVSKASSKISSEAAAKANRMKKGKQTTFDLIEAYGLYSPVLDLTKRGY